MFLFQEIMSQAKKAKVEEVVGRLFFPAVVEKQKKCLHMMNPVYNCATHMHVISDSRQRHLPRRN